MDPEAEAIRLQRLRDVGILDTPDDRLFRGFAEQALALLPGTSIAAVNLIDAKRSWSKTIVGLTMKESPRETSFCTHTIETSGVLVVEDTTRDSRFATNPFVTSVPGVRFYVGVRLMNGVGALCVIGQQPRRVTEAEIAKLIKLAHYVDIQLLAHGTLFNIPDALHRAIG